MATLYMETTRKSAEQTAQEICTLLAKAGASQVLTEYGKDREIKGLRWTMEVPKIGTVAFVMPARVEPIYDLLHRRRKRRHSGRSQSDMEQAKRVAWRQLLRWVQAQLAMIETGMVRTDEVFMPYAVDQEGRTLFDRFRDSGMKMLEAPAEQKVRSIR